MNRTRYPVNKLRQLAIQALVNHGTSSSNAELVAEALIAADLDGLGGHGLSRLSSYCSQVKTGKVDGFAVPVREQVTAAVVRIDAQKGFAYPAMDLAVDCLVELAPKTGIALASITNSHHCGSAGYHVERIAEQGLIALLFANTPKAIAPWGGQKALFGTNPIAFGAPRKGRVPLVIDLALSKVARGKIMAASRENILIPKGWALDAKGNHTTDPHAALAGTMLPMGDAKGAALVLMVEVLAAALTSSNFGFEASSFISVKGSAPCVGQLLIAISPGPPSSDGYYSRMETLQEAILEQEGTRLPGDRRISSRERNNFDGIELTDDAYDELEKLGEI